MLVFRSDLGPRCMSPKPKHGFSPRGGGGTSSNQSESEGFATTRLKRKVVVNQDGPSELGGGLGDLAEGLRLTVPPYAQRVLAVFILMQQDGLAAAHFLAAQNKLAVDSSILNTLRHLVEDAYLALSIAAILEVLNPPTSAQQWSELLMAGRFVVTYRLHTWVMLQNKKGVV